MVVAGISLLVLLPVMLLVAIAIKLDSPGPVFVVQERVRQGARPFRMYKFRSMVRNAEAMLAELRLLNEAEPPLFKIKRDPRLTRVGRYLRRFSIDEIPQLFNVLAGDMSLVGPRPPFAHEVAEDPLRQRLRLERVPGMTGVWQVSGRSELGYEQMMQLDLKYARDWSLAVDLKILLLTPLVVLTGQGAH